MEDCFNWDMDEMLRLVENDLKKEKKKVTSFSVKNSDKWNIYDIESYLEKEGYCWSLMADIKRMYVSLSGEELTSYLLQNC